MNVFALLSFLSFLIYFQAGIFALYLNKKEKVFRVFAVLSFLFAVYAFLYFLLFQTNSIEKVYLYDKLASVSWVFFPVLTVWFFKIITKNKSQFIYIITLFFLIPVAVLSFYTTISDIESVKYFYQAGGNWYYTPYDQTFQYLLFVLYLFISAGTVFYMIIIRLKAAKTGREKHVINVLLLSMSMFFLFTVLTNLVFPLFNENFLPVMAHINALVMVIGGLYVLWIMSLKPITPGTLHNLVLNHMKEFLFILNKEKKIVMTNQFTLANLQYNQYELIRDDFSFVFSDYSKVESLLGNPSHYSEKQQLRVDLIARNKKTIPVMVSVIHIRDDYEKTRAYVLACVDYRQKLKLKEEIAERTRTEKNLSKIRKELEFLVKKRTFELNDANQKLQQEAIERKRAELQTKADLDEKIELVKEVHHRVKNNIQMIISLINMLCNHPVVDNDSSERLRETAEKVRYISHIHEDFYSFPNLSRINFSGYLKKLVGELYSNYGRGTDIVFRLNLSEEFLDINQAIPLGIIFNELLVNAMKYAFTDENTLKEKRKKNVINVEFFKRNGQYNLVIRDNGIGLPEKMRDINNGRIGLQLVNILSNDHLKGSVENHVEYGTQFTILFEA